MVWERIRELKEQENQQAAREIDLATENEKEIEKMMQEINQNELRRKEKESKINKEVFESSGAISVIREIDEGLEGKVRKHAIIGSAESGFIMLAWGNKFKVFDGGKSIGYEKPLIGRGVVDYSYIKVVVNPDNQSVEINWNRVNKEQWQANKNVIRDLIVKGYLNPQRKQGQERQGRNTERSHGEPQ